MDYQGMLIHRKRLERGWSQEGLCKGICAVSYLSKIEQGKAAPSEEVLQLLLERLGIIVDAETEEQAGKLAEDTYEALFSGDFERFRAMLPELRNEKYRCTMAGLDLLLLAQNARHGGEPESISIKDLENCMNSTQLALQRIYQGRFEEAIHLLPNAYTYYCAGVDAYERGSNYPVAIEYLQSCYELAAKEGAAHLMLLARLFIGNCYCNQLDLDNMAAHYRTAGRLARALKDSASLEVIRYNTAASQLQNGNYEEAYIYFAALQEPEVMSLHKLAICCEKLGKKEEALAALSRAEQMESGYPDKMLAQKMCQVVRYRLEHDNYLEQTEYGQLILSCFDECRKKLPVGYAVFHLPWVLEWYTANRQYKKAFDLVMDFPEKYSIK